MKISAYWSLLLTATATLLFPSVAHAEEWFYLTTDDVGIRSFIDRESITRTDDNIVRAGCTS
ncbi:MAG: hypothetical protein HC769_17700 [Cyanobacteria bacterium CRU_2_1]|nr:hypothetical protein [Cyanobacteria bacterium RU_5_0]NJR60503.1 hypothetical protein [Cyanobacteria bacterium CRU_2_1]